MNSPDIPGYTYGTEKAAKSSVTPEELAEMEQAVGLTDDDRRLLRLAGDVLEVANGPSDRIISAAQQLMGRPW